EVKLYPRIFWTPDCPISSGAFSRGRPTPRMNRPTPAANAIPAGHKKFRFRLFVDAFRQASNGPTPVRNIRRIAIGTFTLLKNGAPTVILMPLTDSEITGNIVPQKTAKQAASRIRLLNMKLLSRDTSDSIWFSLFRYGNRSISRYNAPDSAITMKAAK